MSDPIILYRVAEGGPFDLEVDNGVTIENIIDDLVNAKILIPVKPCKHGNYTEHIIHGTTKLNERFGRWFVAAHSWCSGVLTEEMNDETS